MTCCHVLTIWSRRALEALRKVADEDGLQAWKVVYLGRSAELGQILDGLRNVPQAERPAVGRRANAAKASLERAFESRRADMAKEALDRSLRHDRLDVTLPGRPIARGRLHPATQTLRQIARVWAEMGFQIYRSREVETDEYNFGLLNMPPHHPARDQWDTFYTTTPDVLLRTHTSPGQIHVMRERAPEPIRVILPGMCYRYEQVTARSDVQFNQVEGLAVGRHITFGDLKGTLTAFARRMFGAAVADTLPGGALPVHRAVGGNGRRVLRVRRDGLPGVQGHGLAGDPRLRHGPPDGAGQRRLRPRRLHRVCLRPGAGTNLHAAASHRGHSLLLGQ